jgi:hypothetical protein
MGFIPRGASWYIADIVLEFQIEDDPRNVVHVNTLLVEAGSPEEAYDKAVGFGKDGDTAYLNTDGKLATVRFRGLRALNVIHDDLEDGAELTYEEELAVPETVLASWLTEKSDLAVFAPIPDREDTPNYMPDHIAREILARMRAADGEERPCRPAERAGPKEKAMRDPARIDQILDLLREVWTRSPDLRLRQLIVNAVRPGQPCPEVFSVEDTVLARRLERMLGQPASPPDE